MVFVLESLANSDQNYQATWDHISPETKNKFDKLFEDSRFSSTDITWTNELKEVIVKTFVPGATRRFKEFTLDHIPFEFYDVQSNKPETQIRRSRISHSIQNAYSLRSSFAHSLKPLTQQLISQSDVAEEIEEGNETYLTLRGLFRLVRSVMIEFIDKQTAKDLREYNWDDEVSQKAIAMRPTAFYRVKDFNTNQFHPIKSTHAKTWLEDILIIYQDNYIEYLHERKPEECFVGIATGGSMAGRVLFGFDPSPSYDWKVWKEQSLDLIPEANQDSKGYLQAIAMLCAHLEEHDSEQSQIEGVIQHRKMGLRLKKFENLVANIICNRTGDYSGEEAEKLLAQYLKKRKIRLPLRVEIACMIEVARLFQNEKTIEKRNKWLGYVYGDAAKYPNFQNSIKDALVCSETIIEPSAILYVPQKPSFKDLYDSLINEDCWQD